MVTEIHSQTASEAEVAAAAQEAQFALDRQAIQHGERVSDTDAPTEMRTGAIKPLQYRIDPADVGSWVMVWELKLDVNGNEYGIPRRAPRQQLGLWLQKRRDTDGGIRFSVDQPSRIAAEPQYRCLHQDCRKKLYTRLDLVDHVQNAHGREARLYAKLLDNILDQAASENPRVRELAETYASIKERGVVSIPVDGGEAEAREPGIDINAGRPVVTSVGGGIQADTGPELFWCRKANCDRFFDTAQARHAHEVNPKQHRG